MTIPEPFTPGDLDLRDFQYMPLDVVRLIDSDLAAISTGDEFKTAVMLWCKAWHQIPAASLPDDDRLLAHLSGFGRDVKGFQKVRDIALRGFVKCSDGRLYHPVIAEKALDASEAKRKQRERTVAATNARKQKPRPRNGNRDDGPDGPRNDTPHGPRNGGGDEQRDDSRNVHQGKGREEKGYKIAGISAGARDASADLERQLREAAGWQNETAPNLAVTGPIEALIANGAILEVDVLPVIRGHAPKARKRASWQYFVDAIAQARDDRIAAANLVKDPRRPGNERSHGKQESITDLVFETLTGGAG